MTSNERPLDSGHLVGSSASAASVAPKRVASGIERGEIEAPYDSVVRIFPDSSEHYLSKGSYRSFEE